MNERTAKRLLDALTACRQIEQITGETKRAAFLTDSIVQLATERLLEIVGEALNAAVRDDGSLRALVPDLTFAVGMRNKIAHDYDDISNEVVWDTAVHDIPVLRGQLERAMASAPPIP